MSASPKTVEVFPVSPSHLLYEFNMRKNFKNRLRKWIKGDLRDLYWKIYGNSIKNPRCPALPESILFICKGNICRSPFAEHLAKKLAGSAISGEGPFSSAGLEVSRPLPPPIEAALAAKSFGIQLDGHRSRSINQDMVASFDMITAMETRQLKHLRKAFPGYHDKIFLLPLFEAKQGTKRGWFSRYNIQDPYGKNLVEFQACFQRIERCIEGLFQDNKM